MRWNDPSLWIWSPEPTHEALVSRQDWTRALSATAAVKQRAPKAASRPYLLRGRVFCASCGRRMHGQTRSGKRRYYRCAAQARYPGITDAHPRDVLVREQPIIDALDEWLDELFAPEHATQTAQADRHRARRRPRPKRTHRRCPSTHHCREARGRTLPSSPTRHQLASRTPRGARLARRSRSREGTGRAGPHGRHATRATEPLRRRDRRRRSNTAAASPASFTRQLTRNAPRSTRRSE